MILGKGTNREVCGLILAGGLSQRMGELKPNLRLGTRTVLERTTESFFSAGITKVFLVVGHEADKILENYGYRDIVRVVHNPRYQEGMFTSVQAGVKAIPDSFTSFMMMPADCPMVQGDTFKAVMAHSGKAKAARPVYEGKGGHPLLVDLSLKEKILNGDCPMGMKSVLEGIELVDVEVNDSAVLLDMDTPEDYQRVLALMDERSKTVDRLR